MSLAKLTTHHADALSRLTEQMRGKPRLAALLGLPGLRAQTVEDLLWSLLTERSIDTGEGVQLDLLGRLLGQPRLGVSDADYKPRLQARVQANRSAGLVEDLYRVMRALYGEGAALAYEPGFPAGFIFRVGQESSEALTTVAAELLRESRAGGVGAALVFLAEAPETSFSYSVTATLRADVDGGTLFLPVNSTEGWPSAGRFVLGYGAASEEIVVYTGKDATTLYCKSSLVGSFSEGELVVLSDKSELLSLGDSSNPTTGGAFAGALSA